jgi:hypothetical protein
LPMVQGNGVAGVVAEVGEHVEPAWLGRAALRWCGRVLPHGRAAGLPGGCRPPPPA